MTDTNVSLMGLASLIEDPQTCSGKVCDRPAVMWFETFQSTRRYYACQQHLGIMAQNVAMASASGGKVA
ncbi:hypothetical protein AB0D37_06855 [Streptomyces sp. NPDC048384]|uniref:hypothetical protein n=1 Tax=Streptomyces sp. NPDC048384 TaxID=3155487 RepID=UPI003412B3D1